MIYDHTHLDKLIQQFNHHIPRINELIRAKGGIVDDSLFPNIKESYERVKKLKNPFIGEYYGVSDITEIYSHLETEDFSGFPPEVQKNYQNMLSYMNRVKSSYDFNLMNRLNQQYDPVSALLLLADASISCDAEVYDNTTASQEWLDHNFSYIGKIGFSSNYYYDLLKETRAAYERFVEVKFTDEQMDDFAEAVILLQQTVLKDGTRLNLTPMNLDDVQVKALENNNASAESFVGYRNLRDDEVKAQVIARSKFIKENGTLEDVYPFSQLHRIQSGGNILLEYVTFDIDESTGNRIYSFDMLVNAISMIAEERGHSEAYMEKEPMVLPDIDMYVIREQLPESYAMRQMLVETGQEPAIILNTFSKTDVWMYNWKVFFPNVFTLVRDKFPNSHEELGDKIYTKHRSVKASGPDISRVVQSYLYPFMDHLNSLKQTKYSTFVSQWAHPDYLKQMITDMLVMINPYSLSNEVLTTINIDEAKKFVDDLAEHFDIVLSADDKSGFDTYQILLNLYYFICSYFGIAFESNDENQRLFQIIAQQILFPVLLTPEGIHIYDTIIPSGAGVTSNLGTYSSNTAGLTVQGSLLRSMKSDDDGDGDGSPLDEFEGTPVQAGVSEEDDDESDD